MTVPSTTRRAGPYLGNGVTSSFPFTFKVFAKTDIALTLTNASGISTALVLDSDYSVTLNVDQDSSPGGSITYPISGSPMASGYTLAGVGSIPYDQTTSFPDGGAYRASTTEDAFDRTEFQIQQLAEAQGRALTVPPAAAGVSAQLPVPVASNVIGWDQAAQKLVNYSPSDIATVVVSGTSYFNAFNGDGSTKVFTLTADPGSVNALDVAVNGVPQKNGIDFTCSGTTLTFVDAPGAGTQNIAVRYVAAVPVGSANAQDVTFLQAGTGAVPRSVQSKEMEVLSVKDFGAKGDGVADDTAAIQVAFNAAGASPKMRTVWFPNGEYLISSPILLPDGYKLDGDAAIIRAKAGFTGATVNTSGGGTVTLNTLLLFLLGTHNDVTGPLRDMPYIGQGIILDCANQINAGVYMERMPYGYIACKVINTTAGGNAIDIGPYCWGLHLENVVVEDFAENAIALGAASNGVTITKPSIWGKSKTGATGILVKNGGNSNGVQINGGFIEKLTVGVFVGTRNGPVDITGVDFEVCTAHTVRAEGDLLDPPNRQVGPVTVRGCYLDSTAAKVYSDRALIVVEGCRLKTAGVDFQTSANALSHIVSRENVFDNGAPSLTVGATSVIMLDEWQAWTPVLWDDSMTADGQTYAVQKGYFRRVGKEVTVKGYLQMSGLGALTGGQNARIGGLPYTSASDANSHSVASIGLASGLALAATAAVTGYIGTGANFINLQKFSATTGTANLTVTEVSASGLIVFSATYSVS